jgi:hypothetical protein
MAIRLLTALLALVVGLPTTAGAQVIIDPPIPCPWWHCGGTVDVVIEEYRIDVTIEDGIAVTRVRQVLRNDSELVGEGEFIHPIPADAAVTGLTLWIDGEPVDGELLSGEVARRTYEEIVRRTLDPALLEYAGDGLLRLAVFPPPDTRTSRSVPPGALRRQPRSLPPPLGQTQRQIEPSRRTSTSAPTTSQDRLPTPRHRHQSHQATYRDRIRAPAHRPT